MLKDRDAIAIVAATAKTTTASGNAQPPTCEATTPTRIADEPMAHIPVVHGGS